MTKLRVGRPLPGEFIDERDHEALKTLGRKEIVFAIFIGVLLSIFCAILWKVSFLGSLPLGMPSWTEIITVFLILSVGHEVLHLIGFPKMGMTSEAVFGIWIELGSLYVQYLSPMPRNRFLIVTLLPLAALTITPYFLSIVYYDAIKYLSWISVLNAFGASHDLVVAIKLAKAVPRTAWVMESEEIIKWSANKPDGVPARQLRIAK